MTAFAVTANERKEGLDAVDHALEIDIENPIPIALTDSTERPANGHARIVADDVNLPECSDCLKRGGAYARAFRNIAMNGNGLDLLRGQSFS